MVQSLLAQVQLTQQHLQTFRNNKAQTSSAATYR
jgi:hypothetical protein